jgi:hypothetical protein
VAFIPKFWARILRAGVVPGILAGGLFLLSAPASAQISLVHVTSCGPSSFPGSCVIPATGSGNLIVVGWQVGAGSNTTTTVSSMSDNASNTYAEAGAAKAVNSTGDIVDLWYAKNSKAGATSLTVTPSASVTNTALVVWEFAGADTNSPLDQTAVLSNQPGTLNVSAPTVTTSSTGQLVISLTQVSGNVTGVGSGFTNDATLLGNGWAHLVTSVPGTYGATWTQNISGTYCASTVSFKAAGSVGALSSCDLNNDGAVNILDVNLIVSMVLGQAACSANINGAAVCTVVTVQRVVNAALPGGTCVVDGSSPPPPPSHSVTLSWTASTTPSVSYNVYRSTASGGPYSSKLTGSPIAGLSYVDNAVVAGQTYYYVATAVDGSGNESAPSTQAAATIPTP